MLLIVLFKDLQSWLRYCRRRSTLNFGTCPSKSLLSTSPHRAIWISQPGRSNRAHEKRDPSSSDQPNFLPIILSSQIANRIDKSKILIRKILNSRSRATFWGPDAADRSQYFSRRDVEPSSKPLTRFLLGCQYWPCRKSANATLRFEIRKMIIIDWMHHFSRRDAD